MSRRIEGKMKEMEFGKTAYRIHEIVAYRLKKQDNELCESRSQKRALLTTEK